MIIPEKILFTIPNFITAGSGRAMLNIVERLDRKKFAPAVAVLKKGGKLDAEVEAMGLPLIESPFTVSALPYTGLPIRVWQAAQVFRSYHFDLWHSFHYSDDYTEPLIAYMAGAKAWVYTKKNMNWHTRAWWLRSLFARRIAVQNHDMMTRFFPNWPLKGKMCLIPRGVDTEKFRPALTPRLGLREKFNLAHEAPLIACVAELLPVKGHPTLLNALVRTPGAHLLMAGRPLDMAYADDLKRQTADLGLGERVHFLGGVDDVPALLAESDIFVLPTFERGRMEGCPVALLEAMACGKACIATNIPGSRDLIIHKQNGLLVPPEEPIALADVIWQVIQNPELRSEMGQAARKRVEEHYTIERETRDHESLYSEILKKRVIGETI